MAKSTTQADCDKSPLALFYLLEDARRRQDFEQAAVAQRKLRDLGVVVTYRQQQRRRR
jgi:hypothetical protein